MKINVLVYVDYFLLLLLASPAISSKCIVLYIKLALSFQIGTHLKIKLRRTLHTSVYLKNKTFSCYKGWRVGEPDTVRRQRLPAAGRETSPAAVSATAVHQGHRHLCLAPLSPIQQRCIWWEDFYQVGLNSYFTNDSTFNQWPRNERLHFTKLLQCTLNKTYKRSCPWKHKMQHAGKCLAVKIEFKNKMLHGTQKEVGSKKKHIISLL